MKKYTIIILTFLCSLQMSVAAQSSPYTNQESEAIQLASYWFESITAITSKAQLMHISSVPFAMDNKKILYSYKELWDMYADIEAEKGSRKTPKYAITAIDTYDKIYQKAIPLTLYIIEIEVKEGDYKGEKLQITVAAQNQQLKVVGFQD